jgi:cold shock CspA family protein
MRGTVKWYHVNKHFGFLMTEKENREFFFHVNDCQKFTPDEKMLVEFELGQDRCGRTKAVNIRCVSAGVCGEKNINVI